MANILTNPDQGPDHTISITEDFDYSYPNDLDLRPGHRFHTKLRDRILERARESAKIMTNRHNSWREMDKFLTAYIPIDEKEKKVKSDDSRKPVSIIFPYSYAILETTLSYMVTAFFQDPYFRYEGYSPEDIVGASLMELVIQHNCNKNKIGIQLHTMFRDALAYGIGIVHPTWEVRRGTRRRKVKEGGLFGLFQTETVQEVDEIFYEGNSLLNIDPYLFLPDVNVPINDIQKGEYVGWMRHTNYNDLLSEEQVDEDVFNVRFLQRFRGRKSSIYSSENSGRNVKTGMTRSENTTVLSPVDEINMYVKLIPKDWGLGDKDIPEKWFFQICQDEVITKATPANFDHDRFPIAVCAPDFDGYSTAPLSRLEILGGLQETLDWLFNSHIANVRKAINDMIVYDPYLINSTDLKDPEPGKLIRMRRPGWGRGRIQDAVQQLQVTDITRANIADSSWIIDGMQKVAGTDSQVMGGLRKGGPDRLTAKEFQGTQAGAVSRLERIARIIGMQAMQDIGEFFGYHSQQLMSQDTYVKIVGDWQTLLLQELKGKTSRGRAKVTPDQILVDFDVVVRDGSIPGGNYSQSWMKLFEIISTNPGLAQKFDLTRIFTHIARNNGAKNVNDFLIRGGDINPQIEQDAGIEQAVQQGNIAPIGG